MHQEHPKANSTKRRPKGRRGRGSTSGYGHNELDDAHVAEMGNLRAMILRSIPQRGIRITLRDYTGVGRCGDLAPRSTS